MNDNVIKSQAFKLKGRLYTFTVLQLVNPQKEHFKDQLNETVAQAPKLFDKTPVVFDLSALAETDYDLAELCSIAKEYGIIPVAIQGGNPMQETIALCQGMAILNASASQDKSMIESIPDSSSQDCIKSKLITTPIRSGQQVVAKNSDLIVTASVSHGAELLADGSIHIYGSLRGRALAGISGDTNARIFCQSLHAELVSIAGFYRLSDSIEAHNGPCQIYLKNEHIIIEPL